MIMAKLIGNVTSNNIGEKLFISKACEYLDDSNIIYWNRQVFGKEFDICILMPDRGILVIELKGWKEETILRVENNESIIISTNEGEKCTSPQRQARGYRFSIERHIKQSIGKFPLVFQMVCLPQVSRSYYNSKRLDTVLEDSFTLLKEDISSASSFFKKLNQTLALVNTWHRHTFDKITMLEVRNLYETDIELADNADSFKVSDTNQYHEYPYSLFYYFNGDEIYYKSSLPKIIDSYVHGCKLYCVFACATHMHQTITAIDEALIKQGLLRTAKDHLKISFENSTYHTPELKSTDIAFSGFNFSFSIEKNSIPFSQSFCILDGQVEANDKAKLEQIAKISSFNSEQYFVEHTDPDKNIVIKAGAGTGKTHTMISRIGFICYKHNTALQKIVNRIVMITFTNEAANQMSEKLKEYFRDYYLLSGRSEFLNMVSYVDRMQISTIHSYAKKLISKLGTEFGYGVDLSITSSEFYRRRKISDLLDQYIKQKEKMYGKSYTASLGMPIYALIDNILDFIGNLHNKSLDLECIDADAFGSVAKEENQQRLHELLSYIIPKVEQEYSTELLADNKIHLGSMMSVLNRFISKPESQNRIKELYNGYRQYMFIDEFQDTDDTQIDIILTIAKLLNYRLFLVGDIKQCIYRFRGAEEKAFDQLNIESDKRSWQEYQLQINYRTDSLLLDIFHKSFSQWGSRTKELFSYSSPDRLIGIRDYNGYLVNNKRTFYRELQISDEELRIPTLVEEIKRIQKRIKYESERGIYLSAKEKSIAILVRENWQAEMIRTICGKEPYKLNIQTNTGGDLYTSQPALDMMTLVNALVHFDEADYLYNLVTSNFFNLDIPKSNFYELREKIKSDIWRSKTDEREQVNYLIRFMNLMLANSISNENTWEGIIHGIRIKPILQVIREIYTTLEPWNNYSSDPWRQHYYQLNIDLLFEESINSCNTDNLTVNTLQERLFNCIVTQVSVDSRTPANIAIDEVPIQCITVHKAKGLEYGYVILPYCSFPIDKIKKAKLHVTTDNSNDSVHIGYCIDFDDDCLPIKNDYYSEDTEKEERSREETRILYVAMTRSIRSFSWINLQTKNWLSWQNLIKTEV
jgi:superfamily I DNA/RNA helicase